MATADAEDLRSTGRKHLRRNYQKYLADTEGVWCCQDCGRGPKILPYTLLRDHPDWAERIKLPSDESLLVDNLMIEIDHADKNLENSDPSNATALCVSCHKKRDLQTAPGESRLGGDPWGHANQFMLEAFGIEDDPNFLEDSTAASLVKEHLQK